MNKEQIKTFWKDYPNTDTPLDANNLNTLNEELLKIAEEDKYYQATATDNGDYKIDIDKTFSNGDVIKIMFPTATDNDKQARLSVDDGNTYYNVEDIKAEFVENLNQQLMFDNNEWKIMVGEYEEDPKLKINTGQITPTNEWLNGKQIHVIYIESVFSDDTATATIGLDGVDYTPVKFETFLNISTGYFQDGNTPRANGSSAQNNQQYSYWRTSQDTFYWLSNGISRTGTPCWAFLYFTYN